MGALSTPGNHDRSADFVTNGQLGGLFLSDGGAGMTDPVICRDESAHLLFTKFRRTGG